LEKIYLIATLSHHKSHMYWPGHEPGPLWLPPEPWHGLRRTSWNWLLLIMEDERNASGVLIYYLCLSSRVAAGYKGAALSGKSTVSCWHSFEPFTVTLMYNIWVRSILWVLFIIITTTHEFINLSAIKQNI
jgi:hypothetical protein